MGMAWMAGPRLLRISKIRAAGCLLLVAVALDVILLCPFSYWTVQATVGVHDEADMAPAEALLSQTSDEVDNITEPHRFLQRRPPVLGFLSRADAGHSKRAEAAEEASDHVDVDAVSSDGTRLSDDAPVQESLLRHGETDKNDQELQAKLSESYEQAGGLAANERHSPVDGAASANISAESSSIEDDHAAASTGSTQGVRQFDKDVENGSASEREASAAADRGIEYNDVSHGSIAGPLPRSVKQMNDDVAGQDNGANDQNGQADSDPAMVDQRHGRENSDTDTSQGTRMQHDNVRNGEIHEADTQTHPSADIPLQNTHQEDITHAETESSYVVSTEMLDSETWEVISGVESVADGEAGSSDVAADVLQKHAETVQSDFIEVDEAEMGSRMGYSPPDDVQASGPKSTVIASWQTLGPTESAATTDANGTERGTTRYEQDSSNLPEAHVFADAASLDRRNQSDVATPDATADATIDERKVERAAAHGTPISQSGTMVVKQPEGGSASGWYDLYEQVPPAHLGAAIPTARLPASRDKDMGAADQASQHDDLDADSVSVQIRREPGLVLDSPRLEGASADTQNQEDPVEAAETPTGKIAADLLQQLHSPPPASALAEEEPTTEGADSRSTSNEQTPIVTVKPAELSAIASATGKVTEGQGEGRTSARTKPVMRHHTRSPPPKPQSSQAASQDAAYPMETQPHYMPQPQPKMNSQLAGFFSLLPTRDILSLVTAAQALELKPLLDLSTTLVGTGGVRGTPIAPTSDQQADASRLQQHLEQSISLAEDYIRKYLPGAGSGASRVQKAWRMLPFSDSIGKRTFDTNDTVDVGYLDYEVLIDSNAPDPETDDLSKLLRHRMGQLSAFGQAHQLMVPSLQQNNSTNLAAV